jgi:hypothetical protein
VTEGGQAVVLPLVRQAEEAFSAELARLNVEDLAQSAVELGSAAAVEHRDPGYLCPPKMC